MGPRTKPAALAGLLFGRLTVLRYAGRYLDPCGKASHSWICECGCGNTIRIKQQSLVTGNTRSCGCLKSELASARRFVHGLHNTKTYRSWYALKQSCTNPRSKHYPYVGGRGISFDPRWRAFKEFLADMGVAPEHAILRRLDASLGFTAQNCRWMTQAEVNDRCPTAILVSLNGRQQNLKAWARELGISPGTLHYRLKRWPVERALTQAPLKGCGRRLMPAARLGQDLLKLMRTTQVTPERF
jgi:hypothetical protein